MARRMPLARGYGFAFPFDGAPRGAGAAGALQRRAGASLTHLTSDCSRAKDPVDPHRPARAPGLRPTAPPGAIGQPQGRVLILYIRIAMPTTP
jgi:hypothetical protein